MGTAISHVLAFLEPRGTHLPSHSLISLRINIQKVSCVRQISDSKSKIQSRKHFTVFTFLAMFVSCIFI